MYYDLEIFPFALVKYNIMQLRFLFRNLTRFRHEHVVLILKQENTSWLVISGIRRYQNPLSYILKCSLLITFKLVSHVAVTILTFVPYITSCIISHRY
jgi:hypothetical protein